MGAPPNFDPSALQPGAVPSDPGRGNLLMRVLWTLASLATLTVGVRLYVRRQLGALGCYDLLMLLALVCFNGP